MSVPLDVFVHRLIGGWAIEYRVLMTTEALEAIEQRIAAAIIAEREHCATIAEGPFGPGLADRDDYWGPKIAAAIRSS